MKEKLSTLERNQLVLRCLSLTVVYYNFQTVATRGLMRSHRKETRKEGRKPRDSNTWRRRPDKNAKLSIQCRHYYYTKPLLSRNQKKSVQIQNGYFALYILLGSISSPRFLLLYLNRIPLFTKMVHVCEIQLPLNCTLVKLFHDDHMPQSKENRFRFYLL